MAPTHVQMLSSSVEFNTRGYWRGQVAFYTLLPDNDKVMFSDCSYVPYEITLSNPENFVVDERSSKNIFRFPYIIGLEFFSALYRKCKNFHFMRYIKGST